MAQLRYEPHLLMAADRILDWLDEMPSAERARVLTEISDGALTMARVDGHLVASVSGDPVAVIEESAR